MSRPLLCLLPAFSALAPAQVPDGPYWNSVPKPATLVGSPRVHGTLCVMETTTAVHFYSAFHRTWTILPVAGANRTVTAFDEFAIVRDGTTFHAYSSRSGGIDTLPASAAAVLSLGTSSSDAVAVVQDGTDVWGYSGWRGTWVRQRIASSTASVSARGLQAVVDDGVNLHGFGAHHGVWTATPSSPGVSVRLGGSLAIANSANTARVYSPSRDEWTVVPFGGARNATLHPSGGCVLLWDGPTVLAMNGYTGTHEFIRVTSPTPRIFADREVGAIIDGNVVIGYAAGAGRSDRITVSAAPNVTTDAEVLLVDDGTDLHAFSGARGTFAQPLSGPFVRTETNASVIHAARSPSEHFAYSPILDFWQQAPTVTATTAFTLRSGAILVHAGGYMAFSVRTGTWSTTSTSSPSTYQGNQASSIFVGIEGPTIHVYDSRLGNWASWITGAAPVLAPPTLALMAHDGTKGYGYSMFTNVWSETPLAGGRPLDVRASSSIGFVETATHLHTFTAEGSLSTHTRYPESARFEVGGTRLRYLQVGAPGTLVTGIFGRGSFGWALPGLGALFVDPFTLYAVVPLGTVGSNGRLDLDFQLPEMPSLHGLMLYAQNFVSLGGNAWLTNMVSPVIL